jgi:RHS repeat-associated protein
MSPGDTDASAAPRYGYTGRELDRVSGMMDYRARWYDPRLGRFLTRDPLGFAAGDPNLYRYVHNDPFDAVDPTGLLQTHYASGACGDPLRGLANFRTAAQVGGAVARARRRACHRVLLAWCQVGGRQAYNGLGRIAGGARGAGRRPAHSVRPRFVGHEARHTQHRQPHRARPRGSRRRRLRERGRALGPRRRRVRARPRGSPRGLRGHRPRGRGRALEPRRRGVGARPRGSPRGLRRHRRSRRRPSPRVSPASSWSSAPRDAGPRRRPLRL